MTRYLLALFLLMASTANAASTITCTVQTEAPIRITTFYSGWNTDLGSFASYYKDVNGTVHLMGLVYRWGSDANNLAFILPPGYRPTQDERFTINAGNQHATLYVKPDGEAWIIAPASLWVSLASVSFRAQ